MATFKKGIFMLFLSIIIGAFGYALDAEIDEAKKYLAANTLQNWKTGNIDAEIVLFMKKAHLKMPGDRNEAFALLGRYAPYLMKDVYLSVKVDSSKLVGNFLADGAISFGELAEAIDKGTKTDAKLTPDLDKAVMYESGAMLELSKLFIRHKNPYTPTTPPLNKTTKKYTGIIIDARGKLPVHGEYVTAELEPALFPKIWDTDMGLIFEKNMVLPRVGNERLIVNYNDGLDEKNYQTLVGNEPLRIVAHGIFGVNRTDPIISKVDAAKILSKQNLNLIREGRVLIICDNLIKRPKYPQPDENFYFAYRDVDNVIPDKDEGITVDQQPDDGIIKITMYNIHFVADEAEILPTDYGRIDIIAEALRRLGTNVRFVIEGHTAELYRPEEQQALSVDRANAMARELSKRGIDSERITTVGFGATIPLAPSDTEENRAKNRRVEIKILRN